MLLLLLHSVVDRDARSEVSNRPQGASSLSALALAYPRGNRRVLKIPRAFWRLILFLPHTMIDLYYKIGLYI